MEDHIITPLRLEIVKETVPDIAIDGTSPTSYRIVTILTQLKPIKMKTLARPLIVVDLSLKQVE